MSKNDYKYLIDTDALSHICHHEDKDDCYRKIIKLAQQGTLKTVRQVFTELEKHPPVLEILHPHRADFVIPIQVQYTPETQRLLDIVGQEAPYLHPPTAASDPADPWLVAVAKAESFTLVTDESPHSGIKIPAACRISELSCRCISSPHFLVEMGIVKAIKPEHIDPHRFYDLSRTNKKGNA